MTANPPVCSVCIANYNGMEMIDSCLRSVLAQEFDHPVEIIVHDDCSTDGSVAYLREHYPDVVLIESRENVGYCISNNRMVAQAHGRYVLLLNNDAALYPDALSCLLAHAESMHTPGILGLPQYEWESGRLFDIGCLLDPFLNSIPNLRTARRDVAMVAGACLWIPKTLWDEMGGFPEWFGSIGEDLFLCCKARLAGYPVQALGRSGFRHRIGQSFGGGKTRHDRLATTYRRRALTERNKTFVMAMTYPAPFVQLLLPLHLSLLLIEGVLLTILRGRLAYAREIYIPAISALFRYHRQWMAGRRAIMQKRRLGGIGFFATFRPLPYKLAMLIKHGLPEVS